MKILFVVDEYFAKNNGMSISAQRFAEELGKLGHEVRVLASNVCGEPDFPLVEYKIPFFNKLIKRQGMTFARADDDVISRAVEWADVVHLEDCFVLASHAGRIASEFGRPCTGAFHIYPENITSSIHLERLTPLNDAIFAGFRYHVFRWCSDIHCPADCVAERLREHGYKARLHVFSNGITPEFTCERRPKPHEYSGRFVVLMTGRYSVEKRQNVLIKAVLRSKYRDRIQLIFAGQGPLEEHYRRLARKLPIEPVFRFMQKSELMETMSFADLYVHTAEVEIEGISCIEAMASGLVPVIAVSPASSTPQFALDERSLFPSGDSATLAQRMDYWLDHESERAEMGLEYHRHVQRYSIHDSALQFENMLYTALGAAYAGERDGELAAAQKP